ncbi:MAG: hypothetical protein H3C57_08645 [Gammaproteobacteria bacterium]|nr:hypothetical protein [Gammaproteobacteria bacterium]
MNQPISWHDEFTRVISCDRCTTASDRHLLRDAAENVPQPGYIGRNYHRTGVLLIGQNPGTPKTLAEADKPYTRALRQLRDEPTVDRYRELSSILDQFIPRWPVHGNYFPLSECGLALNDIAYFNVVRCRTSRDAKPAMRTVATCKAEHFSRWLSLLTPRVVVFIGKWAADQAGHLVEDAGIPCAFMNRQRSLSSHERNANRRVVVDLVRRYRG